MSLNTKRLYVYYKIHFVHISYFVVLLKHALMDVSNSSDVIFQDLHCVPKIT